MKATLLIQTEKCVFKDKFVCKYNNFTLYELEKAFRLKFDVCHAPIPMKS